MFEHMTTAGIEALSDASEKWCRKHHRTDLLGDIYEEAYDAASEGKRDTYSPESTVYYAAKRIIANEAKRRQQEPQFPDTLDLTAASAPDYMIPEDVRQAEADHRTNTAKRQLLAILRASGISLDWTNEGHTYNGAHTAYRDNRTTERSLHAA